MKKPLQILTACIIFFTTLAHAIVLPPDIEKILQRGTLRIALLNEDTPPFAERSSNGEMVGYDIDMANNLAKQLGVKVVFNQQAQTFDDLVNLINEGTVDLATNITPTLQRATFTSFSQPYVCINLVLFANRLALSKEHLNHKDIHQFNHSKYRIGVVQDSAYSLLLKEIYPKATLVFYHHIDRAIQDVIDGKLFAIFLDEPHINFWLRHKQQSHLYGEVIKLPGVEVPLTLAVSWKNQYLLQWLNKYLDTIKKDGTQVEWVKKYF